MTNLIIEKLLAKTKRTDIPAFVAGDTVRVQGRISHYDAYQRWPQGFWADSHDPARESAFAKLESFGLVSRLQQPNNQNVFADPPSRYALLRKGLDFIRSCAVGS